MVQEAFLELGKIRATSVKIRVPAAMNADNTAAVTSHSPRALAAVEEEIVRACKDAKRDRASVILIAVSKTFDAGAIAPVIESGQRVFGENRVQEAKGKWPALTAAYPGLALHLIGPLQSNKARDAVALFDAIHSVDRPSICQALAKEIESQKRHPQLFVQLNTGEEPQKAGVAPQDADAFIKSCRDNYGLVISGLMCIPPVDEAPAPHFALTAKIAARNGLTNLSMGMSADFATAIKFGATHIRVGSAIFGQREHK
jgi:PLP dependent protein